MAAFGDRPFDEAAYRCLRNCRQAVTRRSLRPPRMRHTPHHLLGGLVLPPTLIRDLPR
jgi:hypothetical protein